MLDARLRPLLDPPLNAVGRALARIGIGANAITLLGGLAGIAAGAAIAGQSFWVGLALVLTSRLLDGLDGAVARATRLTDFGGFLDIVADFVFYTAVPVGFAVADPVNALPAVLLLASFSLTGVSFLAFATLATKRGLETTVHGRKSFFYNTGLAEGTETIVCFVFMCFWPGKFPTLAVVFAGLCVLTVIQRTLAAWGEFD